MSASRVGRLHVLTDETIQSRFDHAALAAAAARGGADHVQLREKRPLTTARWLATAQRVGEAVAGSSTRLIVDDRADVAYAVAAGLHLGRDDLPAAVARRLLGPEAIIGGTANSLEEALAVAETPVDYLGVGPVYGTGTKANPAPDMGLATLARIAAAVPVPVIAIGRITLDRVDEVMATGVHGIAVVSAVVLAEDPEDATRELAAAVTAGAAAGRVA